MRMKMKIFKKKKRDLDTLTIVYRSGNIHIAYTDKFYLLVNTDLQDCIRIRRKKQNEKIYQSWLEDLSRADNLMKKNHR